METLEEKIKRLSLYLNEEAIARAVDKDVDFVRAVLSGEAVKVKEEKRKDTTVIHYVRPAFRQRVVCIAREKGGIGATALAFNIAHSISEKAKVLIIDPRADVCGNLILSDYFDLLSMVPVERFMLDKRQDVMLSDNIYLYPLEDRTPSVLEQVVIEARSRYDAIIIDLPPLRGESGFLKTATAVLLMYGGGYSEGLRLIRHLSYCKQNSIDALLVTTVQQVAVDVFSAVEMKGLVIHLPRYSVSSGIFSSAQALTRIIREIWGREMIEEKKEGNFLSRIWR